MSRLGAVDELLRSTLYYSHRHRDGGYAPGLVRAVPVQSRPDRFRGAAGSQYRDTDGRGSMVVPARTEADGERPGVGRFRISAHGRL